MAGAFVANRGSGNVDSTFSLTWTFATTGAVAAGSKILVQIANENNSAVSMSGGGLTWHKDAEIVAVSVGTKMWITFFSADAPAGLASGTTLTVVDSGTLNNDVFAKRRWSIIEASGLATGAPASTKAATGTGTTNAPVTAATSDSAGVGDFAVGGVAWPNNAVAADWTADTGYTKDVTLTGSSRGLWTQWHVVSGAGAITGHATTTLTPAAWAMALVFYPQLVTSTLYTVTMSETLTITESVGVLARTVVMTDSVSISDSIAAHVTRRTVGMSETLAISDSLVASHAKVRAMTETITISDSLTGLGTRGMSDSAYAVGGPGVVVPRFRGKVGETLTVGAAATVSVTLTTAPVGNALMLVVAMGAAGSGTGVVTSILDSHGHEYVGSMLPNGLDTATSMNLGSTENWIVLNPVQPLGIGDTILVTLDGSMSNPCAEVYDFSSTGAALGAPVETQRIYNRRLMSGRGVTAPVGDFYSTGPVPAGELVLAVSNRAGGTGETASWSAPWHEIDTFTTPDADVSVAYMVTTTNEDPQPTALWTGAPTNVNIYWQAYAAYDARRGINDSIIVHPALARVSMVDNAFSGVSAIAAGPLGSLGNATAAGPAASFTITLAESQSGDTLMVVWNGAGIVAATASFADSRNGAYGAAATGTLGNVSGADMAVSGAFGTYAGLRMLRPTIPLQAGDTITITFTGGTGSDLTGEVYDWAGLVEVDARTITGQFGFGTSFAIPAPPTATLYDDEIAIVLTAYHNPAGSLVGFSNGFATLIDRGGGDSRIGVGWKREPVIGSTGTSTANYAPGNWIAGAIITYRTHPTFLGISDSIIAIASGAPIPPPPPIPAGVVGRRRLPTARWRIILFDRDGNTIGYVKTPVQPKMTFTLNGIDSVTFGVYLDDKIARALTPLATYVKVWRSVLGEQVDPERPIFAGKLAALDEDGQTNLATCTAFSPFYDLQFRYRWKYLGLNKKGHKTWKVAKYTGTAPDIIWSLIDYTNNRATAGHPDAGDTHIVRADSPFHGTALMLASPYIKSYDTTQIWQAITELITGITLPDSTFGGIDLIPEYVHTEGDPTLMVLDTGLCRGVYQPNAGLHYRIGRKNLINMARSFSTDTDKAATLIRATGQGGSLMTEQWADPAHSPAHGPGFDHDYLTREGLYEAALDMGDAFTYDYIKQYALDSLLRRKPPILTVKPELSPVEPPFYGLDFGLGDLLPVAARRGRMEFQSNLRVYGADVSLSNNGNESCTLTLAEDVDGVVEIPT